MTDLDPEIRAWCTAMSEWATLVYGNLGFITDVLEEWTGPAAVFAEGLRAVRIPPPPACPVTS